LAKGPAQAAEPARTPETAIENGLIIGRRISVFPDHGTSSGHVMVLNVIHFLAWSS
jgi:hypothetical protein